MNTYSSIRLDRAAHLRREPDWIQKKLRPGKSNCIPLWQGKNLIRGDDRQEALFPRFSTDIHADPDECIFLGMLDGEAYFAYDCSELQTPPAPLEGKFEDLRSLAGLLPPEEGHCWHTREECVIGINPVASVPVAVKQPGFWMRGIKKNVSTNPVDFPSFQEPTRP